MAFRIDSFDFNLPFGLGGVTINRTEAQMNAAWSLYVEYMTRVATQELKPADGSIREALSSLHELFEITRTVLKEQGPNCAEGPNSVGPLAIRILNQGVRPFLVQWHTELGAFEDEETIKQQATLNPGMKPVIDESKWKYFDSFYPALDIFRKELMEFVYALAKLADVAK